jgi:hypothetical protein
MKALLLLLIAGTITKASFSQAHIQKVEYLNTNRDAIVNEIPFTEKTISMAIADTLEKLGFKGKSSKGYMIYQGVKIAALGNEAYDLYFSIDRKSRKEKDVSSVTLLISKGIDNFITDATDQQLMQKAISYMNDLKLLAAAYELEQEIRDQDIVLAKTEKKAVSLVADMDDLEKKKKKLDEQIADNKKAQAAQQAELLKQKQILDNLRSRRKA